MTYMILGTQNQGSIRRISLKSDIFFRMKLMSLPECWWRAVELLIGKVGWRRKDMVGNFALGLPECSGAVGGVQCSGVSKLVKECI